MDDALARLPELVVAHLRLSLIALTLGIVISLPLGLLAAHRAALGRFILGGVSVVQTIPGLALLALAVVFLGALGTTSIGLLPALIALTLYSMLPMVRNTVTGIAEVDPSVREAALGVGMSPAQVLFKVELPLALPTVVAGVRTAAVWVVGTATLSTPVGAPGLGDLIFGGLQTRQPQMVLVGCLGAALLALFLDGAIYGLQVLSTRHSARRILSSAFALLVVSTTILSLPFISTRDPVKVGAKPFTEQYILAEILSQQIQTQTQEPVEVLSSLGSTVAFDALRAGDLDAYVDYSGTLWTTVLKKTGPVPNRAQVLDAVKKHLAQKEGVDLVASLGFENAYALAMRKSQAESLGITTIADLSSHAPSLRMGADVEFFSRPEWRSLQKAYGLPFAEQRTMDSALMYQAVRNEDVDVISAYSTDGRIAAFDLVVLADPAQAIPPYDAILLARKGLPQAIRKALSELDHAIDGKKMRLMNHEVDGKKRSPAEVAREFLKSR